MIYSSESLKTQTLAPFGWDDEWDHLFTPFKGPYIPGRVTTVQKTRYEIISPDGMLSLPVSGALKTKKQFPVVGDFVVILNNVDSASQMIVAILNRRTSLSRGGAGECSGEQILAANIHRAFIITEPGPDFCIARLERFLMIVRSSGAEPVIILNKTDTGGDLDSHISKMKEEIPTVPLIPISALHNTGLDELHPFLIPGETIIFLGSSGVGKSTLINALSGSSLQKTGGIREDDGKGKHTTTVRHLVLLPCGCSLIDTPGLREIRIWTAEEQLQETFPDITDIASGCRFTNCTHQHEPGCAIIQAIQDGRLSSDRLERYFKIQKEITFERGKAEIGLKRLEKIRYKGISELAKDIGQRKK